MLLDCYLSESITLKTRSRNQFEVVQIRMVFGIRESKTEHARV